MKLFNDLIQLISKNRMGAFLGILPGLLVFILPVILFSFSLTGLATISRLYMAIIAPIYFFVGFSAIKGSILLLVWMILCIVAWGIIGAYIQLHSKKRIYWPLVMILIYCVVLGLYLSNQTMSYSTFRENCISSGGDIVDVVHLQSTQQTLEDDTLCRCGGKDIPSYKEIKNLPGGFGGCVFPLGGN